MRDIDFEELDKAVNKFFGQKESGAEAPTEAVSPPAEKVEITKMPEVEVKQREMVFVPRTAPKTASQLHSATVERKVIEPISPVASVEAKAAPETKKEISLKEDFKEKQAVVRHAKKDVFKDNFNAGKLKTLEDVEFEAPVLQIEETPKTLDDIKQITPVAAPQQPIARRIQPEPPVLTRVSEPAIRPLRPASAPAKPELVVPDRVGVFNLEDKDELKIFGQQPEAKKVISPAENLTKNNPVPEISPVVERPKVEEKPQEIKMLKDPIDELLEDRGKVAAEIGGDDKIETIDEIAAEIKSEKMAEKAANDGKIKVNLVEKEPKSAGVLEKTEEPKPEKIEIGVKIAEEAEDSKPKESLVSVPKSPDNETAQSFEAPKEPEAEKVVIRPADVDDTKPAAAFVRTNVEKRPLGSVKPMNSANFDIKPAAMAPRKQNISRDLRQAKANTPILSSEEYAAPVHQKRKKSGWGVVLAILAILALGGGVGFLAYFLMFMQ